MQDELINWGIIGCGNIANVFAQGLNKLDNGKLMAVASTSQERASTFSSLYNVEQVYTDYHALVTDPQIDAVYIATPHNLHFEHAKLCLEYGKHVLCEKPMAINVRQCKELINLAKSKKLFLMEAVWTRFLPAILKLQEVLEEKIIGEVLTLKADFSIHGDFNAEHRLKNKSLAGGALLDLGIYPITLASIVFDEQPSNIKSSAVIGDTGVDDRSFYLFEYDSLPDSDKIHGKRAILSSSFSHHAPTEAIVSGTIGYIRIPDFFGAQELHVFLPNKEPQIFKYPFSEDENFTFEIEHAMHCIRSKLIESNILPHATTLDIMQTMDTLREQWGLIYDNE